MTLNEIAKAAAAAHLTPMGGVHDDGQTIILLGPKEPGFWSFLQTEPEFLDQAPDPMDRWSARVITGLAAGLDAQAVFPFGGPPFHPFISWALQSNECWQSPVGLLVHKDAGLLVSYRGALVFDRLLKLPESGPSPCQTCIGQPCLTACPVDALSGSGYDVPACKAHIDVDAVCRAGCRVRLSCPVSQSYARDPAQTAFHMEAFYPS